MIALASSRILELGARLWKGGRQYARNVAGAHGTSRVRHGTLGPDKIPAERSVFMFSPMSHAT